MKTIYRNNSQKTLCSTLFLAVVFFSCKKNNSLSEPNYIKMGVSGLTSGAMKPSLYLCTNDSSKSQEIKKAAEMWLASLNRQPQIQVLENNSGNCDASINYIQLGGSPSYTQVQNSSAEISMNSGSQWFVSFGVLVHEFGHAFGLSDTYNTNSGKAGDCVAGQPRQSIMCDPGLGSPQEDDVQGVRAVAGDNTGGPIPDFSGSTNNLNNNILNNGNSNNIFNPNSNNGSTNTNPPSSNDISGTNLNFFSSIFQSLGLGQGEISQIESIAADFLSQSGGSWANQDGYGLTEARQKDRSIYTEKICPMSIFKVIQSENRNKRQINIFSKIDSSNLTICTGTLCLSPHTDRLVPSKTKINGGFLYSANLPNEVNNSYKLNDNFVTLFGKINDRKEFFRCSVEVDESFAAKN